MLKLSLLIFLFVSVSSFQSKVFSQGKFGALNMESIKIPQYQSVKLNGSSKFDYKNCSPEFTKSNVFGIAINSPLDIDLKKTASNFSICSTFTYDPNSEQPKTMSIEDTILFVAVDIDTHQIYYERMPSFESGIDIDVFDAFDDEQILQNEEVVKTVITQWANVDYFQILKIEKKPSRLIAFATVENHVSNIRQIVLHNQDSQNTWKLKLLDLDKLSQEKTIDFNIEKQKNGNFVLTGQFELPISSNNMNLNQKLHSALVMYVTTGYDYRVIKPFEKIIIFKDDVKHTADGVIGTFTISLSTVLDSMEGEVFNLFFSMGPYLSKIETLNTNK